MAARFPDVTLRMRAKKKQNAAERHRVTAARFDVEAQALEAEWQTQKLAAENAKAGK